MSVVELDIAVLGSGFGGTLTALVAKKMGFRVAVFDKGHHPRFAIGESSTPLADRLLGEIATEYDLAFLTPLTTYGSWKRIHPELNVGRKRGFTYLRHQRDCQYDPRDGNLLMVAASESDELSDTHWYRADVDGWLAQHCREAEVPLFEDYDLAVERRAKGQWTILPRANTQGKSVPSATASLVVDATGPAGVVPKALGVGSVDSEEFLTHSAAVFGHWNGLPRVAESHFLGDASHHPYTVDDAAVHHLLEEGWMWQLRFDDGRVSMGICFDGEDEVSPEWLAQTAFRYPTLACQIACSRGLPEHVQGTKRLQRRLQEIAGEDWVALPHTVGFIDPMHSTGIATTLAGVKRLAAALSNWTAGGSSSVADWGQSPVVSELQRIDKLVSLAYRTRRDPDAFEAAILLYTTCAMVSETSGESPSEFFVDKSHLLDGTIDAFTNTLDQQSSVSVPEIGKRLLNLVRQDAETLGLHAIAPPAVPGMYAATATKS